MIAIAHTEMMTSNMPTTLVPMPWSSFDGTASIVPATRTATVIDVKMVYVVPSMRNAQSIVGKGPVALITWLRKSEIVTSEALFRPMLTTVHAASGTRRNL